VAKIMAIAEIPGHPLYNRLQILIRYGLDNVPIMIEHLNVTPTVPSALLCVTERLFTTIFAAIDRRHTFSLKNFPTVLFMPARIARRPDLNDSCAHGYRQFEITMKTVLE
jgi:hypothetical protein